MGSRLKTTGRVGVSWIAAIVTLSLYPPIDVMRILTVASAHAAGDLHQDAGVAEDHDCQWQQEEAHEGEHVVEGLLPVLHEAAMGGALGEVLGHSDGHYVEYEHLPKDKRRKNVQKVNYLAPTCCKMESFYLLTRHDHRAPFPFCESTNQDRRRNNGSWIEMYVRLHPL